LASTRSLVPSSKLCEKCSQNLEITHHAFEDKWFYCQSCELYTHWSYGTKFQDAQLSFLEIDRLLTIFLSNKTPKEAFDLFSYDFVDQRLSIKTIRKYFTTFCNAVLDYYQEQMNHLLIEKEVEID